MKLMISEVLTVDKNLIGFCLPDDSNILIGDLVTFTSNIAGKDTDSSVS